MKIEIPQKDSWAKYADELEQMITDGCNERDIQSYLNLNRWIVLLMFGESSGVCFTEYIVGPEERSDYFIVSGGSFPDATFLELKSPQAQFFDSKGKMSVSLNEAMTKSLNKMFMVNVNYDFHHDTIGRQIDELIRGMKPWYQGVFTPEIGFVAPFEKFVTFRAAIVLGRDGEIPRNDRFREGAARFLSEIKIYTYDSILRKLRPIKV